MSLLMAGRFSVGLFFAPSCSAFCLSRVLRSIIRALIPRLKPRQRCTTGAMNDEPVGCHSDCSAASEAAGIVD